MWILTWIDVWIGKNGDIYITARKGNYNFMLILQKKEKENNNKVIMAFIDFYMLSAIAI